MYSKIPVSRSCFRFWSRDRETTYTYTYCVLLFAALFAFCKGGKEVWNITGISRIFHSKTWLIRFIAFIMMSFRSAQCTDPVSVRGDIDTSDQGRKKLFQLTMLLVFYTQLKQNYSINQQNRSEISIIRQFVQFIRYLVYFTVSSDREKYTHIYVHLIRLVLRNTDTWSFSWSLGARYWISMSR